MSSVALRKPLNAADADGQDLQPAQFAVIAKMVHDISGIHLTDAKIGLASSRLQRRLRALKLSSFTEYMQVLNSSDGAEEVEEMICSITTNVTHFNREGHHFRHFESTVMPQLIDNMKSGKPARVWSAGCSNGSEPYSLAASVMTVFPNADKYDFRILATDIDKYSLRTARAGIYDKDAVSKLPADYVDKWFKDFGAEYEASDKLKALIQFNKLNLMKTWPMKMPYDVIFCRNVLIYFSAEDQIRIFDKFANLMKPGSHLYIGHSERLIGPLTDCFEQVDVTTYQYLGLRGK